MSAGAERRRLIVLGSTGSIGENTLEVVAHLESLGAARFDVVGLAGGRSAARLAEQAGTFDVPDVALAEGAAPSDGRRWRRGEDACLALVEEIARPGDLVVAAVVGAAGLPAVLAAIDRGCDLALANKETLVAAGEIVMPRARAAGVRILPVDSEHSALAQAMRSGRGAAEVRRMVLTASGGPFRAWSRERIEAATPAEALDHPTWSMGRKVTIDSASLMNKALELIEAHWLFDLPSDRLDAIVHPQSIVHSFVEFLDGSVIAQLSPPDMRLPIQYALTDPDRVEGCARRLDWSELSNLAFEPVDHDRFPAIALAHRVIEAGGSAGAVLNAANEAAVEAFLDERIPFGAISALVAEALDHLPARPVPDLDAVLDADREARALVRERIESESRARSPWRCSRHSPASP